MKFTNQKTGETIDVDIKNFSDSVVLNFPSMTFRELCSHSEYAKQYGKKRYEKIKDDSNYCPRCRLKKTRYKHYKTCIDCYAYSKNTTVESLLNGTFVLKTRGRKKGGKNKSK